MKLLAQCRLYRSTDFYLDVDILFSVTAKSVARARHLFYVFENSVGNDGLEFDMKHDIIVIVWAYMKIYYLWKGIKRRYSILPLIEMQW